MIAADPNITEAEIMYGDVARIGSRVKHYGQRYTTGPTATIIGFYHEPGSSYRGKPWVKVLVEHDNPESAYAFDDGWDWDRTEMRPGHRGPLAHPRARYVRDQLPAGRSNERLRLGEPAVAARVARHEPGALIV